MHVLLGIGGLEDVQSSIVDCVIVAGVKILECCGSKDLFGDRASKPPTYEKREPGREAEPQVSSFEVLFRLPSRPLPSLGILLFPEVPRHIAVLQSHSLKSFREPAAPTSILSIAAIPSSQHGRRGALVEQRKHLTNQYIY